MPYDPNDAPELLHTKLIDRVYGTMSHPAIDPSRKASYAKIFSSLMGDAAKAAAGTGVNRAGNPMGRYGGGETSNPTGLAEGEMIQPKTTWAGNPLPGVSDRATYPVEAPVLGPQVPTGFAALLQRLLGRQAPSQFGGAASPIMSALQPGNPIVQRLGRPTIDPSILNVLRGL